MRLKEVNYFGFDHAKVNEQFKGELTYLRTFTVRGRAWAVYHAANPNRELGHKDYMMLCTIPKFIDGEIKGSTGVVSGSTPEQMEEERYQDAILCTNCQTVIYSINTHHFHSCGCEMKTFVDGGKDYTRSGGANLRNNVHVKLDLLTGEIVNDDGTRTKLEIYHYSENPEAKVAKRRKSSHRSEKLTARRKSGKIKSTRKGAK